MLDMKTKEVEEIVYLASYIVVDPGTVDILQRPDPDRAGAQPVPAGIRLSKFKALTGAEAIRNCFRILT